ncbi:MAG: biotin transporter BioY [Eubacteriales bacterium]
MKITTKNLILIALFVSITIVLSQIVIPLQPVPISLSLIAVFLSGALLGWKKGMISQFIYILLGVLGLPVFAKYGSGLGVLFGPTGGYLLGYITAVIIIGYISEKFLSNHIIITIIAMLLGMLSCYLLGTIWLGYVLNYNFLTALSYGVLPFILGDILKIILSAFLVQRIKKLNKI